jgi:hypothetical protein
MRSHRSLSRPLTRLVTRPAVPSAVAYLCMRRWQRRRVKPWGQRVGPSGHAVFCEEAAPPASISAGEMPGWVARSTEVNCYSHREIQQAKDAVRLEPKRYVVGCSSFCTEHTDKKTTGVQAGPTSPVVMYAEHGKPDAPPVTAGRPQGRLTAQRVEESGESEGRSVMERIRVATSPGAKASRLPQGLPWQESLRNRDREEGR